MDSLSNSSSFFTSSFLEMRGRQDGRGLLWRLLHRHTNDGRISDVIMF